MDVVAKVIEIGLHSAGVQSLQQWIAAQVAGSIATNLLGTVSYKDFDQDFILAVMATTLAKSTTHAVGTHVAAASFDIRNDGGAALVAWLNVQQAGISAPVAPSLTSVAGGTLTGQGTVAAKISYVTATGESIASAEATLAVADNHELVVASPVADPTGLATGWNVYVGGTGAEHKQNASPLAIGTPYTQAIAVTTNLAVAPVANTTAAKYLQSLSIVERGRYQKIVTAIVSN